MEPIKSIEIRSTDIRIQGPSIIPAIEPPTLRGAEVPVVRGLELPIINMPSSAFKYPTLNVPTQEEFDAAVRAEQKKQQEEKEEKSRGLPDAKPVLPQIQVAPLINQEKKTEEENNTLKPTTNLGVPVIEVPLVGQVPVPPKEQVILAGTTATASVAAALIGKSLVEWMVKKMKPIVEQLFVRGKKLLNRDLTPYELQVYFAFEKTASLKKVNKLLNKEQKKEKKEQYKKFHSK
jgi:hypothetical protein